ncbi:MAG TPA: hypothetical protein VF930_04720 [Stellaceae bacterium]
MATTSVTSPVTASSPLERRLDDTQVFLGLRNRRAALVEQQLETERLGQVGPAQPRQARVDVPFVGGRDDRDAALRRVRRNLDAGHSRHHDVEDDEVRAVAIEHGKRLLAGAGAGHAIFPCALEGVLYERAEPRLVVDDEHVPHIGAPAETAG